jgi:acyl carrier protein
MAIGIADLKEILVKRVGIAADKIVEDLGADFEGMGIDSLGRTELLRVIEQDYGIRIPERDAPQLTTMGSVITYTNARLK